ncbi:MAG: type II toxin-antitoxin system HicB family antitoxin [Chloroflexota bacterium]|nr:type II toxin-antitoxin system HicB family antitoxin [Chloroflexota bacterium]
MTGSVARRKSAVKIKVVIHDAEEGGYWVEVPALPGCVTEGDTFEELLLNLYDAVEGWLSVDAVTDEPREPGRELEIAV